MSLSAAERSAIHGVLQSVDRFLERNLAQEAGYWDKFSTRDGTPYLRAVLELSAAARLSWASSVISGTIPSLEDLEDPDGDSAASLQIRVDDLESINETLRATLDELEEDVQAAQANRDAAENETARLQDKLEEKRKKVHRLHVRIGNVNTKTDRWRNKAEQARREVEELEETLQEYGGPKSLDSLVDLLESWKLRGERIEELEGKLQFMNTQAPLLEIALDRWEELEQGVRRLSALANQWARGQDRQDTARRITRKLQELLEEPEKESANV